MRNVVIVDFRRSPFTPATRGALARVRPDEIAAQVVEVLRSLPARLPSEENPWSDLVFSRAGGGPLPYSNITKRFQQRLKDAGLPRMRWHDLRHGSVSLLLGQGVPLTTISDMLGHASYSITKDIYGALAENVLREAADAMDDALRGSF